jgi:hypothetical protein
MELVYGVLSSVTFIGFLAMGFKLTYDLNNYTSKDLKK